MPDHQRRSLGEGKGTVQTTNYVWGVETPARGRRKPRWYVNPQVVGSIPTRVMMPMSQSWRDEMSARRADEAERAGRDKSRAIALTALACVGWAGAGIFCLMWSAHTTDVKLGWIAVWAGLGLGNGGVLFTLLRAYLRGERRGDW